MTVAHSPSTKLDREKIDAAAAAAVVVVVVEEAAEVTVAVAVADGAVDIRPFGSTSETVKK